MALTREFKRTIQDRVRSDPKFANALLSEAAELFLKGEPETAKRILRDLINATFGVEEIAAEIHCPDKSVYRMLSTSGNPTMTNLSAIFATLQRKMNVDLHAHTTMHK